MSIAASSEFAKMHAEKCGGVATKVFYKIQVFFPIIKDNHKSLATFFEKVIGPSIVLAQAIQTSPTLYTFWPSMTSSTIGKRWLVPKNELGLMRIIDAKTGKTLKADSPIMENNNGLIGEQIALLTPALYRCTPGEKSMRLTQEVVLIELYHPLGRRHGLTMQENQRLTSDNEDLLA